MSEPLVSQSAPADLAPVGRRRPLRSALRVVSLLLVMYLLLIGVMMFFETSLIFVPAVYPNGIWNPKRLAFEDAWFEADDGTRLHGWYVPHQNPRAVVLFAHGNAGNLSHRADLVSALVERLGVSVMVFDYRGYGRSEGSPTEAGVLADARAARAWLAKRAEVDESQIVLLGESLGGGVMVDLAARDGARALVLDRTFSSVPDVAAAHYPWLPVRLVMRTQLNSVAKIGDYQGPVLQVHGDADRIVPIALARRLFEAAREPKELVIIPGGDHNDPPAPAFFRAFDSLLGRL